MDFASIYVAEGLVRVVILIIDLKINELMFNFFSA
jgi:hypothetical protein